ncbi:unnamed protein product [Closterium sp. Naga37s-1]|nr:unnamed protein product [Closterium sp. Naga37s-1]
MTSVLPFLLLLLGPHTIDARPTVNALLSTFRGPARLLQAAAECTGASEPCPGGRGGCVATSRLCDGVPDCGDASDEGVDFCDALLYPPNEEGNVCNPEQFQLYCPSGGGCMQESEACDGKPHCADGSDESLAFCKNFVCDNVGRAYCPSKVGCMPPGGECNGVTDCADGSDEGPQCPGYQDGSSGSGTSTNSTAPSSGGGVSTDTSTNGTAPGGGSAGGGGSASGGGSVTGGPVVLSPEEKKAALEEKKRKQAEKAAAIAEKKRKQEEKAAAIAEKKRKQEEKAAAIAEKKRKQEEKAAAIAEKKRLQEAKAAAIAEKKRKQEAKAAAIEAKKKKQAERAAAAI